jgi:hypothetical protein
MDVLRGSSPGGPTPRSSDCIEEETDKEADSASGESGLIARYICPAPHTARPQRTRGSTNLSRAPTQDTHWAGTEGPTGAVEAKRND